MSAQSPRFTPALRSGGAAVIAILLAGASPATAADRLPRDVAPTSMTVQLTADPRRVDYSGVVTAALDVKREAVSFQLHARELTVTRATITGPGGTAEAAVQVLPPDRIEIVPASRLAPGGYSLKLEFKNRYSRRAAALYRVETGGESYLFTQFEATEAREAFPCWDEPEFKIRWQVELTVPASHLAVGNMPVASETEPAGGMKTVTFRRTPPMPSYLVAIAVGPFETVPIRGMSVPGRIVCVKGASGLAGEAARVSPPLLAALEKYFGRSYPYDKLDLIAAPEFLYGAMENAGAIVFADRRLLLDPRGASAEDQRAMRSVIAHEMAHMWFGDLVTMRWWDDLWLNESFATWMAANVMDQVFPEYRSGASGLEGSFRGMETDARPSVGAMRQPIASADNLSANANELTYNKGRAVLDMFEGYLGEKRFRDGVLAYLAAHQWSNATGNDLWEAISKSSGEDVTAAMASFLDQGGVPIVTVEPLEGGRVRLRQRRFLTGDATPDPSARWRIPVILSWPEGRATRQHRAWLATADTVVQLPVAAPPAWILGNGGASGYYHWNVPPGMLAAIAGDRARLTAEERIGFVRNLVALERAGLVPVEEYLPLLFAFRDEADPEVVNSVVDALNAIREPLVAPEALELFAERVRRLLQPVVARMGRTAKPGELPATGVVRPRVLTALGDLGQDPEVRSWADAFTERLLSGADEDRSLAESALRLSAQRGGPPLAARMRARFEQAAVATDRNQYLTALGSFRDPRAVEEILDYVLAGPLRPQEVVGLPTELARSPVNRPALQDWLESRYADILGRVPPHLVSRLMPILRGCDPAAIERARRFFADPAHPLPGAAPLLARTSDAVGDCVRMAERDRARFTEFLRREARVP